MKYLNTYKLHESFVDIKSEIKDILRDCEDMGLYISVDEYRAKGIYVQISCVGRQTVQVQFKDILPNVQHLINYMKSIGYGTFNYVDTLSEFNIYYKHDHDDYTGREKTIVASDGIINNILPIDDDSRSSWIGIGKMMFLK